MADVKVPLIATATPTADDTVVGVQGGAVKRFGIEELGRAAGVPYASGSISAQSASIANHATSSYNFIGCDATDDRVFVNDVTGGVLRQSADHGSTWSNAKGWPTNVTYANVRKILRFKTKLYLLAKDTSDSIWKVWSCDPAAGNTAFTWSSPLHALTDANSLTFFPAFSTDGTYIYVGEYGDPGAGPAAWRTADGSTWDVMYGPDATLRHIHAIAPDPYNAGHVYMTCGDGTAKTIQRSTDSGANWSVVVASSAWQAVQISFTERHVFFAGDSQRGMAWFMDRDELVPRWYSPSMLKNIAVPAAAASTDSFYYNGYFGCIDPDTGIFYASANDSSSGGNTAGLFQIVGVGHQASLIEKYAAIQAPCEIFGGYLWVGKYRRPVA